MYVSYIVKRTQIYLDVDQDRRLARRAAAAGATKSTLIREAIESYLTDAESATARLGRFRAALDVLERHSVDVEDGRAYVERIRTADEARLAEIEDRRR